MVSSSAHSHHISIVPQKTFLVPRELIGLMDSGVERTKTEERAPCTKSKRIHDYTGIVDIEVCMVVGVTVEQLLSGCSEKTFGTKA